MTYVGEPITVSLAPAPTREKRPACPDRFSWRGTWHEVAACLAQWHDFGRRGRFRQNQRAEHLRIAVKRGSWGVGRFFFRIRTATGRCFEIYYDRSPAGGNRKGSWVLYKELAPDEAAPEAATQERTADAHPLASRSPADPGRLSDAGPAGDPDAQ